jgi:hypothetical protein
MRGFRDNRPFLLCRSSAPVSHFASHRSPFRVGIDGWLTLLLALVLLVALHLDVILREESFERKFGEQYLSFKRRVRRWV